MKYCVRIFAVAAMVCSISLAHANTGPIHEFNFPLSVDQTNPSAMFPDGATLPTGFAKVTLDSDTDTISWDVSYQDLTGPIVAPGAHFHGPAALGTNAGVKIFLTSGTPEEPASGTLVGSETISESDQDDVLAGLWYINIHTADNMPGELRGQVVNIPEPASLALLACGLAAFATGSRRQR